MTMEPTGDDPRPIQLPAQDYRLTVEIRGEGRKVYDAGNDPGNNDGRTEHHGS